jgi:hypothetical protein
MRLKALRNVGVAHRPDVLGTSAAFSCSICIDTTLSSLGRDGKSLSCGVNDVADSTFLRSVSCFVPHCWSQFAYARIT